MLGGVWALMERSLRTDVRNRWSHVLRLAALLVGYGAMMGAAESATWFGAPGLRFFQSLTTLNAMLIALGAIGYFASTITEEKEEGTLGLMLMAGLSPLGILLGKFGVRLVQAGYLVLLQIPFALLAVTLGGVTPSQIAATMAALLSLLFLTANVALAVSVVSKNSRQAAFRMTLVVIAYCVVAFVLYELRRYLIVGMVPTASYRWYHGALDSIFFNRISSVLSSGWAGSVLSIHEWVNLLGGVIAFGFAWGTFGWATRQPDTEAVSRGWLGFRIGRQRLFTPGRAWQAALAWKEFYFLVGGWPMLALKGLGYFALVASVWIYWHILLNRQLPPWGYQHDPAVEVSIAFLSMLLALEAALLASRLFHDEVRGQTWAALASLPEPLPSIAYRKTAAAFVGLLPVCIGLFWLCVMTETGRRGLGDALDETMFWGIVTLFVAIAHLAALFSLYVRWGIVPLAGAAAWLPFIGFVMMIRSPGPVEDEIGVGMMILYGGVCVACHFLIGRRLAELAAA